MIVEKNEKKMHKLTEPKVLEILIASLKALHKQQESKRKNYKRLINSFSVRVQKYEDSSSNADTANEFKKKKTEMLLLSCYSRRKKNTIDYEYSHNSDSSIYNKESNTIDTNKLIDNRVKHSSISKSLQAEKIKFLKHKFCKQIDQKSAKKFLMDTESCKSPNNQRGYNNNIIGDLAAKNLEMNKDLIMFDSERYECDSNNNCSFSLDQKNKIIYVKESPQNDSLSNSKNISGKATTKVNDTPASNKIMDEESDEVKDEEDNSEQSKNLDHEVVIEKLKSIEKLRNRKRDKNNNNSSSDCN